MLMLISICPVLLPVKIPTAMLKYSIHTSTLNDIVAIEGKMYLRKPYVSKGPSNQKMKLLNTENLWGFSHVHLGFHLLRYIFCLCPCLAAKQLCFALAWIPTGPRWCCPSSYLASNWCGLQIWLPPLGMPTCSCWHSLSSPHPLTLRTTGAPCRPGLVLGLGAWNWGNCQSTPGQAAVSVILCTICLLHWILSSLS